MSTLSQFDPPAGQDQSDFSSEPSERDAFRARWSQSVEGWTQQAILGNPWNQTNSAYQDSYVDLLSTDVPADAAEAPITWPAFPGRIAFYFPNLSPEQVLSLADTGYYTDQNGQRQTFPNITIDPCSNQPYNPPRPYGPYGPRGWQDEYCEWSVTRDGNGNITRVDFTCENPEYWYSLWKTDPKLVCTLYQQALDKPQIQLEDLYLCDGNGNPVIDPETGMPAYNPLNKWNSGTQSGSEAGGAMHLTSTPNTLQTEMGLVGGATVLRTIGNSDPTALICCAVYGQPHRNSDPHIGQSTNQAVATGYKVCLANPSGLYIQTPDFSQYTLKGQQHDCSQFWTVKRGQETVNDYFGNPLPGNFILHAVFEVPSQYGTVSDVWINNAPIQWGGQIAQTFNMGTVATAISAAKPSPQQCVGSPANPTAQPLQMMYTTLWNAYYGASVQHLNPLSFPMNLASNTTLMAPMMEQGQQGVQMTLTCVATQGSNGELPQVSFPSTNIAVTVKSMSPVTYAVPGNSYPSEVSALEIEFDVPADTPVGPLGVQIANPGQQAGPPMPALMMVAPARSLKR